MAHFLPGAQSEIAASTPPGPVEAVQLANSSRRSNSRPPTTKGRHAAFQVEIVLKKGWNAHLGVHLIFVAVQHPEFRMSLGFSAQANKACGASLSPASHTPTQSVPFHEDAIGRRQMLLDRTLNPGDGASRQGGMHRLGGNEAELPVRKNW